jgi:hypothetical protein
MNIALWIVAGLLAVVVAVGGVTKTFVPQQRLASTPGGEWTAGVDGGPTSDGRRRRDLRDQGSGVPPRPVTSRT